MIEISLKGFAKYVSARDAARRKILQDYKYPNTDEPTVMRLYYRDVRDRIEAYHRSGHAPESLDQKAQEIGGLATLVSGRAKTRLRANANALRAYRSAFADRQFKALIGVRLPFDVGDVRIKVTPDLHVLEGKRERIVRLEFAMKGLNEAGLQAMSQVLYEAARKHAMEIRSSDALILDVFGGAEIKGARAGARALRDIEATCESMAALWSRIDPPVRRTRSK